VNDGLKVLLPTGVNDEKVLNLYSDAAAYMLKAATALKDFYPNSIHFTGLRDRKVLLRDLRPSPPQEKINLKKKNKCF
jgi:hypothetical protein